MTMATCGSGMTTMTQSYFDELVLENQDVFDLSPHEAVVETMDQLYKQQQQQQQQSRGAKSKSNGNLQAWKEQHRVLGLSLTHPDSQQGQQERQDQRAFQALLQAPQEEWNDTLVQQILNFLERDLDIVSKKNDSKNEKCDDDKDDECQTVPPVLLGNLFWQSTAATNGSSNIGSSNDENKMTNSTAASSLTKLCTYASADQVSLQLALQVCLRSLSLPTVAGFQWQRRNRQEQMLHDFVLPSQGWQRLFGCREPQQQRKSQAQILWLQLIHQICQGHEPNKKYCNSKPILQVLVSVLQREQDRLQQQTRQTQDSPTTIATTSSNEGNDSQNWQLIEAACRVISVLCRFDDFSSQATKGQATDSTGMVVSSAHSTVTTLASLGLVTTSHELLVLVVQQQSCSSTTTTIKYATVLLTLLQALRNLAIQDEIVVRMVSTGLLEVLQTIFEQFCSTTANLNKEANPNLTNEHNNPTVEDNDNNKEQEEEENLRLSILTALIGLYRNLSANDELKTTLCRSPQHSILGPLIASLQSITTNGTTNTSSSTSATITLTKLQEHVCATLGSMALRQPQNAQIIVETYQGHLVIIKAMQMSQQSPLVQRQGALALRNLASRATSEVQQAILDAGAEQVLRQAATLGAVDEAYGALRDLGIHAVILQSNPETGELERQPMFGEKPLQFRPVYD